MINGTVEGGMVLLISIFLFFFAWKKHNLRKYNTALLFLLLGGAVLRLFTAFDPFLHEWDERFHALVAKNLLTNPLAPMLYVDPILPYDYKNWTGNHIWLHKQPFPLYATALSMYLFGKSFLALRLPSILFSLLTIFSTAKIGEILFSKRVGFIAAFLCAIHGLIIELTAGRTTTDHIDIIFLSLVSFALLLALKSAQKNNIFYLICCGCIVGFAILTKWLTALIVIPLWILAMLYFGRTSIKNIFLKLLVLLTVIVAIALPWQLYILHYFPLEAEWEYAYNSRHIFEYLEDHKNPFYYHFDRMRILFGEIIYLPFLWLLYIGIKKKHLHYIFLLVWILVPYLFFSFAKTKMQGYTMFTAPAFFILTGFFFQYLRMNRMRFKYPKFVTLLMILLIALPIRYSFERIKPFHERETSMGWVDKLKRVESLEKNPKRVLFNFDKPIRAMFHSDFIVYSTTPTTKELEKIKSAGYAIYIHQDQTLQNTEYSSCCHLVTID